MPDDEIIKLRKDNGRYKEQIDTLNSALISLKNELAQTSAVFLINY